jgi:gluconolactonase
MLRPWYAAALLLLAGTARAQDMPLTEVLLPGEGWRHSPVESKSLTALAGDRHGSIYAADEGKQIIKIGPDGTASSFARISAGVSGLAVGPAGEVYAAQPSKSRVVRVEAGDREPAVIEGLVVRDLTMDGAGRLWCTVPTEQAVYLVDGGKKRRVAEGIPEPSGITLWPDGATLLVADAAGSSLWTWRIGADGSLSAKERYYPLRTQPKQPSRAGSLTMDRAGRAYAACPEGIQVFDPTGRLSGVLLEPERARTTAVAFGGKDLDQLYTICGGKLFVRKTLARGVAATK